MENADFLKYIKDNSFPENNFEDEEQDEELFGQEIKRIWNYEIKQWIKAIKIVLGIIIVFFSLFYLTFWNAPNSFPKNSYLVIESGQTLSGTADYLYNQKIIKSEFWFKAFSTVFSGSTKGITAGDYKLEERENVFTISWRLTHSKYRLTLAKITIPEGTSVVEMTDIFSKKLADFDKDKFIKLALPYEGYLFPDTYLFMPDVDEMDIINTMRANFEKRIETLNNEIKTFGKKERDIIIMASIVEKEARIFETRRMVAGILWKRLKINMPLQVDVVFPYISGIDPSKITLEDLKIDSPYNTYTRTGLPIAPITNPGLETIKAVITPISSKYFYYLSDKMGEMHYAITHDEHVANKDKYLR